MRCGISFHVLSKLELLLSVLSGNAYLSPPIVLTAPSQIFCGIIFQPGIEISSTATDQVSCNCLEFRKKTQKVWSSPYQLVVSPAYLKDTFWE
jgi:hypothetical protein